MTINLFTPIEIGHYTLPNPIVMTPLSRRRVDHDDSGSPENQVRFLLEVLGAMIDVWGAEWVGVRISPTRSLTIYPTPTCRSITPVDSDSMSPTPTPFTLTGRRGLSTNAHKKRRGELVPWSIINMCNFIYNMPNATVHTQPHMSYPLGKIMKMNNHNHYLLTI